MKAQSLVGARILPGMSPSVAALLSVGAISLISLLGVAALGLSVGRLRRLLLPLVALAAGAMLGDAFLHLLPQAVDNAGGLTRGVSLAVLAGVGVFLVLEKVVHWQHSHELCEEDHVHPLGVMNLVGDAFHNLIDGVLIAAAYLGGGMESGLTVTVAVALHEIPQELGDFAILVHAGYTPRRALFFNLVSALAAVVGAVLVLVIGRHMSDSLQWMLPFTAGAFIYIAASDLIPEIRKEQSYRRGLTLLGAFLAGIALILLLETGHDHGHGGGHDHDHGHGHTHGHPH